MSSIEPSSVRSAAKPILYTPPLPDGVRTLLSYLLATEDQPPLTIREMAASFNRTISCVSLWIRQAKRAGLLTVTQEGRRNRYRINYQQLQRLTEGVD